MGVDDFSKRFRGGVDFFPCDLGGGVQWPIKFLSKSEFLDCMVCKVDPVCPICPKIGTGMQLATRNKPVKAFLKF